MKKNLAKKITLSILAGAMLMSSSVAWAAITEGSATGESSNAIGSGAVASGFNSNAIGTNANASGINGNAIGIKANASGFNSNAIGTYANATKDGSIAVGLSAEATGLHSNAIGTLSKASGKYSNAFGYDAKASAEGAIALGYGSVADEQYVVSVGSGEADKAYGYRKIVNIKDGSISDGSHDAVTGGQLFTELGKKANADKVYTKDEANALLNEKANKADVYSKTDADAKFADKATTLAGYGITDAYTKTEVDTELDKKADKTALNEEINNRKAKDIELEQMINNLDLSGNGETINNINQRFDKTNTKINRVGAGAAALAALHPLEYDPDDKLTFSAGMGNYAGENAAALGAFYRPNEKFMVSLGGTMGNGENMVNLGLSIGLDKPNGYAKLSKRELIQEVNAVKAENQAMKDQLANADERIAKLEALVAQLVKK